MSISSTDSRRHEKFVEEGRRRRGTRQSDREEKINVLAGNTETEWVIAIAAQRYVRGGRKHRIGHIASVNTAFIDGNAWTGGRMCDRGDEGSVLSGRLDAYLLDRACVHARGHAYVRAVRLF